MTERAPVLRVDDADGVRLLTMNRPEARNAFNIELYDRVRAALEDASASPEIATCLITGAGDMFSAGQDLKEYSADPAGLGDPDHGFVPFVRALAAFDKPLVAAVNGAAVGVGFTMLLHCDLVFVSDDARFRTPFVALGFAPEAGSSALLPARIGPQAAANMLFSGAWMDAEWAVTNGLAWQRCSPSDLLAEAMTAAVQIASMPLDPLIAAKKLLLAARSEAVSAALDRELAEVLRLVGLADHSVTGR